MRALFASFIISVLFAPLVLAAPPPDLVLLKRLETYMNNITTMTGSFRQKGPGDLALGGKFWISRPGRMRFHYDAPQTTIIIADGIWIAVQSEKDGYTERYPLGATPARFILNNNLRFQQVARIKKLQETNYSISLWLASRDNNYPGRINLRFRKNPLALEGWTIIDAQGMTTRLDLTDVRRGIAIDPQFFFIKNISHFKRKRR